MSARDTNREIALGKLFAPRNLALPRGITSVCSAHPLVIEAALLSAARDGSALLIEATCNQVNQDGGYTGMTPADFRRFVESCAARVAFPAERIILGGDHLGPNPWRQLPAEEAMARAEAMIVAYVEAGFEKLHLDTSMGCAGEPAALNDERTAERAARLAKVAEQTAARIGSTPPVYVIGTEVPPPGGATHALDGIEVTRPEAARKTMAVHEAAFRAAGVEPALERVIAIVVQPGVEFGNANVVLYQPEKATGLIQVLDDLPGLLFEAHSTDYQPTAELAGLVDGGFAILKVGPGLTFALGKRSTVWMPFAACLEAPTKRKAFRQCWRRECSPCRTTGAATMADRAKRNACSVISAIATGFAIIGPTRPLRALSTGSSRICRPPFRKR